MTAPDIEPLIQRWVRRASRAPGFLRAALVFSGASLGGWVHVDGRLVVTGARGMRIGDRSFFLDGPIAGELSCAPGAELVIGSGSGFNYGLSLCAARSIRIGARCLFGALVRIRDDDGLRAAPVVVGNEVWLAHGSIIEPGVTIGDGAVVSAGSVVLADVPAGMMAVGNPARCIPMASRARAG